VTLHLARPVREELVAHAREGAPEEVCGVLGGSHGEGSSRATLALRATNAADSPRTRYELDPAEQLELMRTVEQDSTSSRAGSDDAVEGDGDEVVGFYHSHPRGPPAPSDVDAREATWTGHSYVIVSLGGDEPLVRSWRWTGEAFEREAVEVRG
jgi:proteasome lid subunit RPN8/RPN11